MGDRMGMPLCKDPTPPLYGPFSGTTWVSQCQKRTSGLYGARKINRGRHTDQPAGRHSIWTNQCPPPPSSALTLLVGQQEGIRPVKMGDGKDPTQSPKKVPFWGTLSNTE